MISLSTALPCAPSDLGRGEPMLVFSRYSASEIRDSQSAEACRFVTVAPGTVREPPMSNRPIAPTVMKVFTAGEMVDISPPST